VLESTYDTYVRAEPPENLEVGSGCLNNYRISILIKIKLKQLLIGIEAMAKRFKM
jgi:hypothetical protein